MPSVVSPGMLVKFWRKSYNMACDSYAKPPRRMVQMTRHMVEFVSVAVVRKQEDKPEVECKSPVPRPRPFRVNTAPHESSSLLLETSFKLLECIDPNNRSDVTSASTSCESAYHHRGNWRAVPQLRKMSAFPFRKTMKHERLSSHRSCS